MNLSKGEPVNFYPIPKIEDNFRKKEKKLSLDYNFLRNSLFNLTLFLNATCMHNCTHCKDYCKQFHCCTKFLGKGEFDSIDTDIIREIFKYAKFENLNRINILGGDLSLYKDMDLAFKYLADYQENCFAYFKYDNIQSINPKILSFFDNRISIVVDAAEINRDDIDRLMNDYNKFVPANIKL